MSLQCPVARIEEEETAAAAIEGATTPTEETGEGQTTNQTPEAKDTSLTPPGTPARPIGFTQTRLTNASLPLPAL